MQRFEERLSGDTPGADYRLTVLRFDGRSADAPSAYLQAALHASELPGVAALHYLVPLLEGAERDGRLLGRITVVPHANPIGAAQILFGELQGRFALGSRVNFNRDFPLLQTRDTTGLPGDDSPVPVDRRLKARLLSLALPHDLILDLHCDDESLPYLYVPAPYWPHLADLASCLGAEAVVTWADGSDGAFEEAAAYPALSAPTGTVDFSRIAATTVELRGVSDVTPDIARADAEGLYRFLVLRGVVADEGIRPPSAPFGGPVAPIETVEVVKAPAAGVVLHHVRPGDRVTEGEPLATIVTRPGDPAGDIVVRAPQGGLVFTRRSRRVTGRGEDLLKLIGSRRSAGARPGTLED